MNRNNSTSMSNSTNNIPTMGPPDWSPLQRLAAKRGKYRNYVEIEEVLNGS